jgi:predicted RNase H-like HicB family nuclease
VGVCLRAIAYEFPFVLSNARRPDEIRGRACIEGRTEAGIGGRSADIEIKVVVHEADEGGFWAEVPAIPGCATEGDTIDELLANLLEAIEGCLSVDVAESKPGGKQRILEIAV